MNESNQILCGDHSLKVMLSALKAIADEFGTLKAALRDAKTVKLLGRTIQASTFIAERCIRKQSGHSSEENVKLCTNRLL